MQGDKRDVRYYFLKYYKIGLILILGLFLIGIGRLVFDQWYGGEITCIRHDGKMIYYKYGFLKIKEMKANDKLVERDVIDQFSELIGFEFNLKKNYAREMILNYEIYNRSEEKKSVCY